MYGPSEPNDHTLQEASSAIQLIRSPCPSYELLYTPLSYMVPFIQYHTWFNHTSFPVPFECLDGRAHVLFDFLCPVVDIFQMN